MIVSITMIDVGSLLQYKEACYGRFHNKLPKLPFEHHQFLPSINQNVFMLHPLKQFTTLSPRDTARKKFVLFCAQIVRVQHPRTSLVGCNYLKCFISDPYIEGETTDGWVREEWVEPLNELGTYYDENIKRVKEKYNQLRSREKQLITPETVELFTLLSKTKWR